MPSRLRTRYEMSTTGTHHPRRCGWKLLLARTLDGTGDGEAVLSSTISRSTSVGTPKLLPSNTTLPFAIHRPLRISNEALLPFCFRLTDSIHIFSLKDICVYIKRRGKWFLTSRAFVASIIHSCCQPRRAEAQATTMPNQWPVRYRYQGSSHCRACSMVKNMGWR